MALKAELKFTSRTQKNVPGWMKSCKMQFSPNLTASSADLFICKQTAEGPAEGL